MRRRLQFISIKTKIITICLIVIIVPIFVMTVNTYTSSQGLLERKYTDLLTDLAKQSNIRIEEYLNEVEKISLVSSYGLNSSVSVSSQESFPIQEYLRQGSESSENAAYSSLMNYIAMKDGMFSIYIYNLHNGHDLFVSSTDVDYSFSARGQEWFRRFVASSSKVITRNTYPDEQLKSKPLAITHARKIFDMASGKLIGVMVVSIDIQFIDAVNSRLQEAIRSRFTIVDGDNNVIYNADLERIGSKAEPSMHPDSSHSIVVEIPFDGEKWTTYLYMPMSELSIEGELLQRNSFLLAGVLILFTAVVSILLSNIITRPAKKLMSNIALVERGQFEQVEDIGSRDEFGLLSIRFNKMAYEVKMLIERVQLEEMEKSEAEMRALQSQINPHFLYNTLGSVKWIASMQRADKIVDMTEALISMLRYTARAEGSMVKIREELENLNNYITIQNVRYYNRIQMISEVDEELFELLMPKLILQPIVENAIFHGLAEKEEDGIITLRMDREGHHVRIEVRDNGVGMDEETVRSLRASWTERQDGSKGIGLYNVNRRLQLHFGQQYGIEVESESSKGTVFRFIMPEVTISKEEGTRSDR
ncbi:two-component system sensor histidine kinase YesM [Paenibacillus cellulosilyticus]|uniref:histidine kinase n=1 Tax=Paenibacillus cellulosilyticus TaxID=375489 RepID=A0A2V2YY71_9BACL|nr:sensor histidine kinase [Paenibacillus cellulosilyticus]PWW07294.1 two-component system sensor histidine kinase YesM [Paenibacillus cellulosilyticus]QKS44519.1 sensor histidine kinase [Paenibacillus cellulosilyticus]